MEKKSNKKHDLNELIDWAEVYLKDKKQIAHGFRLLRNLIHTDKLIAEQDVPEAIRHISIILNLLYELPVHTELEVLCSNCGIKHRYNVETQQCYIGNNISFGCDKFRQNISVIMMP